MMNAIAGGNVVVLLLTVLLLYGLYFLVNGYGYSERIQRRGR